MTAPPTTPSSPRAWWTRPAVMLPLIAAVVLIVAIETPEPQSGRLGDSRLSSHLSGSLGARLFHDMAARLGWRVVVRDSSPVPSMPPGETIHAVLAPPLRPTPAQAHRYLDAVRNGDALLLALEDRNPLSDSLGVRHTRSGGVLAVPKDQGIEECTTRDITPSLWPDGQAHLYGIRFIRENAPARVVFATVHAPDGGRQEDAAFGFQLGRGRVVVVSDPDLLRNDVLRRCQWGADLVAVRMLEWLRDGGASPRTRLEFDEYHQGYGPRHSATATVGGFLARHPVGRAIVVLVLGALVLLLAVSPRALLPTQRLIVERRDPLEQVDALAHAYEQVRATRTAVARLLHGVRGRVERGGVLARGRTDDDFLDDVVAMDQERAGDVALVRRALREPAVAGDLPTIGAALRRIEHSFTTTRA